jgi:diguanylate cyclase (GGDEF)-like protein/PAS domain S-box-containing protein
MDATWTDEAVWSEVAGHLVETAFIAETDADGRIQIAAVRGRSLERIGLTHDDVLGVPIERILPPEAAKRAYELWPKAAEGELLRLDLPGSWPVGWRHLEIVAWGIGNGRVAGIAHDRTSEHVTLRRLREREALSRGVLDAIESGTAVIDTHGRILAVNATWVRRSIDADGAAIGTGPGDDYVAGLDADLPEVAQGLRTLLAGGVDAYEADQEIDGCWWTLRVLPIELDNGRGAVVTHVDITERVRQEQALRAARDRWETAFEGAGIGMALVDLDGRFVRVNRRLCAIVERSPGELLGTEVVALAHPEEREVVESRLPRLLAGRTAGTGEYRFARPDGSSGWLRVTSSTVEDASGVRQVFVQFEDVTARKLAEARLDDHRRLLELIASGAPIEDVLDSVVEAAERHLRGTRCGIATGLDDRSQRVIAAPRLSQEYVAEVADDLTRVPWALLDDLIVTADLVDDARTAELAALAAEHGIRGAWVVPIRDEAGRAVAVLAAHDRTEPPDDDQRAVLELLASVLGVALARDRATQRLARKSLEDPLTGLPNRALFVERLDQAVARLGRRSSGIAVVAINLDRFSRVNDGLGHRGGDEALVEAARRLSAAVPSPDTVARSGGDEFLVLCEEVTDEDTAAAVARRALEVLAEPFVVDGIEFRLTASAGVTVHTAADPLDDLELEAHAALGVAKAAGRGSYELFRPTMRRHPLPGLALEQQLRQAIAAGEFRVHYQPEVALGSNQLVGFEALVRWQHPDLGLLPPSSFIDAAEDSGLIVDIGRFVLDEALAAVGGWTREGEAPLQVAVNISARQLADPHLVEHVVSSLDRHGVHPSQLMLEITESVLVEDAERTLDVFRVLREHGVRLAIDDFGTGYSTLLYLKRFPVDAVKVDRSFVDGLGEDAGDSAIVAAVVRLAHELELTVIAEGVETPLQVAHLRRLGCEVGQGFLWSRPVPAEEAEALARAGVADVDCPRLPELEVVEPRGGDEGAHLDELLAVLTHELSTPLTVIGGYAEMLHARLATSEAEQLLPGVAAIERNVHNLARLVTALADARGTAGGPGGEDAVTFDLVAFAAQTLTDLSPILEAHEARLQAELTSAPVEGDPVGIRQVLTNLLGNAAKFAPAGSDVDVVVQPGGESGTVELAVVDHGAGVPPDRIDELFGRFSRLGSTRKGLGLGLYLSRTIARRHGGDIVHRPTPGGGATFAMTLPLAGG